METDENGVLTDNELSHLWNRNTPGIISGLQAIARAQHDYDVGVVLGVENPYSVHMDKVKRTTDREVAQMEAFEGSREAILKALKERDG